MLHAEPLQGAVLRQPLGDVEGWNKVWSQQPLNNNDERDKKKEEEEASVPARPPASPIQHASRRSVCKPLLLQGQGEEKKS